MQQWKRLSLQNWLEVKLWVFFCIFRDFFCNIELVTRSSQILQILVFYNVLIPFGATAAYTYQGIGSGFKSLGLTVLRELILSMFFAYLLGIILNMGVFGVYLGSIIGMNIGSAIGFMFILLFNKKFKKEVENLQITPHKWQKI